MKAAIPDICVLVASRLRVVRADFVRGELVEFARDDDGRGEGLVGLVELAASLGGALPKRVWILSEEMFALGINVRAQAVEGLSREDTLRLLGFEAQAISGLPAGDALVAAVPSPAAPRERGFTVVQIARADRDAIESSLAARGARLAGITHPAGVPLPIGEGTPANWRRLEAWPDLVVDVESAGGKVTSRFRRTDPTRRARDVVGDAPVTETLETGGGPMLAGGMDARAFDLAREVDLRAWIAAWGRALHEDPARTASIGAAPRALSARNRGLIAVGGAVVAAAVCGVHYMSRVEARDAAVQEFARAREPAERLAKTRNEAATLAVEVTQLESEAETMLAALARAGWSADAPARLLDAAATGRPEGLTIDSLEVGWRGARLRGVALRPELPDELGRALSGALVAEGFVVAPVERRRRALDSGAEVFEYTLEVLPRGVAPVAAGVDR